MGAPVVHFEVTGTDPKKLQRFFAKLFDWKIDTSNPMGYGMVHADGQGIGVGEAGPGPGGVTFYDAKRRCAQKSARRSVQVEDLEGYLTKAEQLDALAAELDRYHLFHATRGELLRELGRDDEARAANRRALELTENPAERRLLERRIRA